MDEKIVFFKPNSIKPYENNAKIHNEDQINALIKSISEFGFTNPVLIDEEQNCIAGHGRLLAAERMGLKEVPCRIIKGLTNEQKRALILADNKIAEMAEWDYDKLEMELSSITDIDMSDFGFDLEIDEHIEVQEDDYEIDEHIPTEPRSVRGGLYKLGDHILMCGDSTDSQDVKTLLQDSKIDLVLTDPPYNVAYVGKTDDELTIENDKQSDDEFIDFLTKAFTNMHDALKSGSPFYIWHASSSQKLFEVALNSVGLFVREQLIWNKNSLVMGRFDYHFKHEPCFYGWKDGEAHKWYSDRKQTTVMDFDRPNANTMHPTMKPVALFSYLIENSSKKGDNVLDLFGGSGTTLIACEQLKRRCFMMEIDPKYCDVIIDRWETYTGRKAECLKK